MKKFCNQTGRTMVEILSVLAIIGVLSVLSVYAYRYAMFRLKANEVIDFVSRFYTQALAADSGECAEDIDNTDLKMSTDGLLDDLTVILSSCPHEGCGGHIKLEGESLETEEGKKICALVVSAFGNEPAPGSPLIVDCAGFGYDSTCPEGRVTGTDSDECDVCQEGRVYLSYNANPCAQEPPEDFEGCTRNEECEEGEYCALTGNNGACHPKKGECLPVGGYMKPNTPVQGLGYVMLSNDNMNWWSAENWCKAQGKSLIPVEDFQVYRPGTTEQVIAGSESNNGGGCASGKDCGYWSHEPYKKMWNGVALTGAVDENGVQYQDRYSSVLINICQTFNSKNISIWTGSYAAAANQCVAFLEYLGSSSMFKVERDHDAAARALCR